MLEFIGEVFFEVVLEGILSVPGAFIRWLYFQLRGRPKPFKICLKNNLLYNVLISIGLIVSIVIVASVLL